MFGLVLWILLALRFYDIGIKAAHHDETINAWFTQQVWAQGGAPPYDPANYHGPLLFWLYQVFEMLGFRGIEAMRVLTTGFSVLSIWWLVRWLKTRFQMSGWALLGLMLSPAFLFFSRSAIHESGLVFFILVATTGWIDYWILKKNSGWLVFVWGLLGALLMKETFVFPLAFAAPFAIWMWVKEPEERLRFKKVVGQSSVHLGVCLMLWFLFFSQFGRYPANAANFVKAFLPWTKTGVHGSGHEKPALYFLEMIFKYEFATVGVFLLAVWGTVAHKGWVRWLSLWSLAQALVYSVIPYKTPWCLISIQIPLWVAGVMVIRDLRRGAIKWTVSMGLFVLALLQVPEFYRLNFQTPPDPHPYVYVQTKPLSRVFVLGLKDQLQNNPEALEARVLWGAWEAWPFPSWLSEFPKQASFAWTPEKDLESYDLVMVDTKYSGDFEARTTGEFWKKTFQVREAREDSTVYLRKSFFQCPFDQCEEFVK